jgi:VIT1/CCC1 family predicted Fe2+/Mn2+ transporter
MTTFNHSKPSVARSLLRDVVFGMEDGMVSTLGAVVGIAVGSANQSTVVLAGMVVVAVESISMGIGSYISNASEKDALSQRVKEEKHEIKHFLESEKEELYQLFVADGWSENLATQMTKEAEGNKELMLKEMMYREHGSAADDHNPIYNGLSMFLAYIVGGLIPLSAYFVLPLSQAVWISTPITLFGLFVLGAIIAKLTNTKWFSSGLRVLFLGGLALVVGFSVGYLSRIF